MDLSQFKPSKGFVEVFDTRPFKPCKGQSYNDMRGQQVAYQQLIRDWDEVTLNPEAAHPSHVALLEHFSFGIGTPRISTSTQRPRAYVRFDGNPARPYDTHTVSDWGGAIQAIITAQAAYIEHVGSLPQDKVYPHRALLGMNAAKAAEEALAMEEDDES